MKTKFIYGAIAALFALNVSLCAFAQDEPTWFEDEPVWFEDDSEDINVVNPCKHGGPGATNCDNGGGFDFMEIGAEGHCEVTCAPGYYACCGARCTCISVGQIY